MMRLGIVGPGLIWEKRHEGALQKLTDTFTVTAFCASSERHKAEALSHYPKAAFVTDYEAFVKRDDIDAVVVLTPIELNAPVSLTALRAGKDVFLEKPMAHSLALGQELTETAAKLGRRLWILEQDGYDPRWLKIRDLINAGEIGEMTMFDYVIHWPLDTGALSRGGYGDTAWRIKPAYPLGAILDGGHHNVATLSTILGQPKWVFASGESLRDEFGTYDHILAQFGYNTKLHGTFSHSAFLSESRNYLNFRGTTGLIAVDGNNLVIERGEGKSTTIEIAPYEIHELMWNHFAQCIAENREPSYTYSQGFGDLSVLFAMDRSIQSGARADL